MEEYVNELVTGVVLAFKGRVLETGDFEVIYIASPSFTCPNFLTSHSYRSMIGYQPMDPATLQSILGALSGLCLLQQQRLLEPQLLLWWGAMGTDTSC
jgi:hypothetical protein